MRMSANIVLEMRMSDFMIAKRPCWRGGEKQIYNGIVKLNKNWSSVLSGYTVNDKNKARILVGIATHIAMDVYAHKAYISFHLFISISRYFPCIFLYQIFLRCIFFIPCCKFIIYGKCIIQIYQSAYNYVANYIYVMRMARICFNSGMSEALSQAKYPCTDDGEKHVIGNLFCTCISAWYIRGIILFRITWNMLHPISCLWQSCYPFRG